jgi:hypothetical protein
MSSRMMRAAARAVLSVETDTAGDRPPAKGDQKAENAEKSRKYDAKDGYFTITVGRIFG